MVVPEVWQVPVLGALRDCKETVLFSSLSELMFLLRLGMLVGSKCHYLSREPLVFLTTEGVVVVHDMIQIHPVTVKYTIGPPNNYSPTFLSSFIHLERYYLVLRAPLIISLHYRSTADRNAGCGGGPQGGVSRQNQYTPWSR